MQPKQGKHYGVPGVNVDGQDMMQMLSAGRAVTEYVRSNGPAILQVRMKRSDAVLMVGAVCLSSLIQSFY